jgi:nucleoid-associated protein YgaU
MAAASPVAIAQNSIDDSEFIEPAATAEGNVDGNILVEGNNEGNPLANDNLSSEPSANAEGASSTSQAGGSTASPGAGIAPDDGFADDAAEPGDDFSLGDNADDEFGTRSPSAAGAAGVNSPVGANGSTSSSPGAGATPATNEGTSPVPDSIPQENQPGAAEGTLANDLGAGGVPNAAAPVMPLNADAGSTDPNAPENSSADTQFDAPIDSPVIAPANAPVDAMPVGSAPNDANAQFRPENVAPPAEDLAREEEARRQARAAAGVPLDGSDAQGIDASEMDAAAPSLGGNSVQNGKNGNAQTNGNAAFPATTDPMVDTPDPNASQPATPSSAGGPGGMSEEDMAKARELSSKLKTLALGAGPEEYTVQPGDTLWDISDQLLDDPFWWPKLWQINADQVKNPNLIYPGMVLVFYPSDGESAPALAVRDVEVTIDPKELQSATLVSGNAMAAQWRAEGPDGAILDPDSLPKDPNVLLVGDFQASTAYAFRLPGFMTLAEIDSVGEIRDVGASHTTAIVGTVAYADFDSPPKAGERFLTLRRVDDIADPEGERSGLPLYTYTSTVGVVHLNASGVVSLLVETGPSGAAAGDLVVPFRNLYVQVNPATDTRKSSLKARVLGVLDDYASLSGEAQAVFLEKAGPVTLGEELDIFMPAGGIAAFDDDEGVLDRVKVATARVVEVGDDTVTAVILRSSREVSVGATTWALP